MSKASSSKNIVVPNPRQWRMGIYKGVMTDEDETLHTAFYTQDVEENHVHVYGTELKNWDKRSNRGEYQRRAFWVPNKKYNEVDYLKSFGDKVEVIPYRGPAGGYKDTVSGEQVEQMRTIMNTTVPRWSPEWVHSVVRALEKAEIIDPSPGYSSQLYQDLCEEVKRKNKSRARN